MLKARIMEGCETPWNLSIDPAPFQGEAVRTGRRRAKILLVDDTADNLVSLEAALEGLDEELIMARSGLEALHHVLENEFAAILLDVKMPEMDGLETAEIIRTRKLSRNTPIIFLTGYRSDEHLFRGYDLGAVDFLFKPIMPEILRSKVSVFVELWRSIEGQKAQAETLRKTEQQFRSLLEAAPDAMVITKENGEIVLVNTRAESIFGCPRDRFLGRNIRTFLPHWRPEASSASEGASADLTACRRDGIEFPASITSSPVRTEDGVLITSAIRDVTERRKAEEYIRQLNLELEKRVTERTAALSRSNEQLTQFAYAASHDLQEPLRMVVSYVQLLERRYKNQLDSTAVQFINYAVEGALRMEALLTGLREYLRVEEERAIEMVDCNLALDAVRRNLETAIRSSGADVTSGELPKILAFEVSLVQIFQNLVGNAIKYRGAEAPRIHVSAERHLPGDSSCAEWLFSVKDNGMGIEPQYLNRIFGIFKRLHGAKYAGAGIGLAICSRAVEHLGGRIWAESQAGQGSTFFFTIPEREWV